MSSLHAHLPTPCDHVKHQAVHSLHSDSLYIATLPAGAFGSVQHHGSFGGAAASSHQQQPTFGQQRQTVTQHRGLQAGRFGNGHAGASAAASAGGCANGLPNGQLHSSGVQSEEDELLSGVFNKVWEDNLQVYTVGSCIQA